MKIVKTFEIEYDGSLGEEWFCLGNLLLCLQSKQFVGPDLLDRVEEIETRSINHTTQRLLGKNYNKYLDRVEENE